MKTTQRHAAFTLVEIAIVLVIIGLLVGGVLVGQDLVLSAKISSTASQIEKYKSASNTFRTKMGGIPGDLNAARAISFGLTQRAGTAGSGDGNGSLQNGATQAYERGLGHETALYWRDLSQAGLIEKGFATATDAAAASIPAATITDYLPNSKLSDSSYIHAYGAGSINYYYIGGVASTATDANGVLSPTNSARAQDSQMLDEKIDDGNGSGGSMFAVESIIDNSLQVSTGLGTDCLTTTGTYNVGLDTSAKNIACRVTVRAGF